jgi:hypothetical protein
MKARRCGKRNDGIMTAEEEKGERKKEQEENGGRYAGPRQHAWQEPSPWAPLPRRRKAWRGRAKPKMF